MKRGLATLAALVLLFSGCAIHIHNASSKTKDQNQALEEWHQSGILRLDLSEPIDLSTRCPSGWSDITTEKKVSQLFVTALSFTLYDPWAVRIACNKPPQSLRRQK